MDEGREDENGVSLDPAMEQEGSAPTPTKSEVQIMIKVKANSPREELEWALCELRRCREDAAEAILAEEAAEERVRKAREEVNKARTCDQCGLTPKLAMDTHLVLCVRKSSELRKP
jgi:hypothetical protein